MSWRRAWLALACAAASCPGVAGAVPQGPGVPGLVNVRSTRGSELRFFGWSRDSRLIAYTRQRIGRARPDQRMHRFVEDGSFAGFGKMVGGDVARYAQERGYVARALPVSRPSESRFSWTLDGDPLVLSVEVGQGQTWRLVRGDLLLAEHTFDRIYVDLDVALYPAPDATQAVLVMHLDTGWEVDAAIFPVSLVHATTPEKEK